MIFVRISAIASRICSRDTFPPAASLDFGMFWNLFMVLVSMFLLYSAYSAGQPVQTAHS